MQGWGARMTMVQPNLSQGPLQGTDKTTDIAIEGNALFEVEVDNAGNRKTETGLAWSLVKVERNYQWYRSNNSWSYEPVTFTKAIATGRIDASATAEAEIRMPVP